MGQLAVRASVQDDVAYSAQQAGADILNLANRMESARSRIETRFLDGGSALLSILDILNKLVSSLDTMTGSLDETTANATMSELEATVERLSQLTRLEASRQAEFHEVALVERKLAPRIVEMLETLRYLRTFAVTAKITGAGIPDFSGFAEEILERIREGNRQVNDFSDKLRSLSRGLGPVLDKGRTILTRYEQTVPAIMTGLSRGAAELGDHRALLNDRACKVKKVASAIQSKLAATLSAMQIGDITRQRIEHCQSSFQILSDYLEGPEGRELNEPKRQCLEATIRCLVHRQLSQALDDFERDTTSIVSHVGSFRSDLDQIETLRMTMTSAGGDANAIRQLEKGVTDAHDAVSEIEDVAGKAGTLSRSTVQTVSELLNGIGVIRAVRTDIHYMALNTNLRCGKIGEEGKAVNVVTAELRNFAARLDEAAEAILCELQVLEATAAKLVVVEGENAGENLGERLQNAVSRIGSVASSMDVQMALLSEQSHAAVDEMNASLKRLDFNAEIGDVLRACVSDMAGPNDISGVNGMEQAISEVSGRIYAIYTMANERDIHRELLGLDSPAGVPAANSMSMSDDDIEDALF